MKLAADLLCSSLRIVDAVVANLPAVGIICLGARPADNEAKGVDNNITKKGHCSKPADVPHSRVFVVIPHTLKDKAKAGDEFHFNLGNIKLKAKFLRDQKALADGRNKVSVRAFLPTEKMSNGLDCAFFSSVSKQINDSSFYVKPPPDVQPGEVFEVVLFGQKIKIRYPQQVGCDASKPSNSPNQKGRTKPKFRILCCPDQKKRTLGTNPMILMFHLKGCCTCSCVSCTSEDGGAGVHPIKDSNPPEFLVTVPDGTKQNQQFPVEINRQQFLVTCPPQCSPGEMVRIRLPIISTEMKRDVAPPNGSDDLKQKMQLYEVKVPEGVGPGGNFCLLAQGSRVLVTCPNNARSGQRIRFKLPIWSQSRAEEKAQVSTPDGKWVRAIRAKDLKFQWVPPTNDHLLAKEPTTNNFSIAKDNIAYLRQLKVNGAVHNDHLEGQGELSLVPAMGVTIDTTVKDMHGHIVVSYPEIEAACRLKFDDKVTWFQEKCRRLQAPWNEGNVLRINVRREKLLEDSLEAIMSLRRNDMRKNWKFELLPGSDDGGVMTCEWWRWIWKEIFDEDSLGRLKHPTSISLTQTSSRVTIDPTTGSSNDEDYLHYFRFLGRLLGKALFDGRVVTTNCRMERHIYKYLLQWPIQFEDLKHADEEYFQCLKKLQDLVQDGEDISMLCLDFTTTTVQDSDTGKRKEIELVDGGADIEVTNENVDKYIEASFKFKMMGSIRPQLTQLLLGFTDVIPEPLLTVFNPQELEYLLHGMPEIDTAKWKLGTSYSGEFETDGANHPVCQWFWEIVEEYEYESKASLLYWTREGGTTFPSRLVDDKSQFHGDDCCDQKFVIHGVTLSQAMYPRDHTSFKRLDLPLYETKEELRKKIEICSLYFSCCRRWDNFFGYTFNPYLIKTK